MEEEDCSEVGSDDNIASQTVVQNLELLPTTLQSFFRSKIAIVCDDIGSSQLPSEFLRRRRGDSVRDEGPHGPYDYDE